MKSASFSIFLAAWAAFLPPAWAGVVWDESSNGELSKNHLAPTPVSIGPGLNTFKGTITNGAMYYDYATVTVPSGCILVSLTIDALTNPGGNSIFGLAPGKTCEAEPSGNKANTLLGWVYLNMAGSIGRDILLGLAKPNHDGYGNSGFTIPLKAGDYTFWIQDYNTPVSYQFTAKLEKAGPPAIVVKSKKLLPGGVFSMNGTIKGYGGATVTYRIGTGKLQKTKGSKTQWTIPATQLKKGRITVTVTAKGDYGTSTKKFPLVVK